MRILAYQQFTAAIYLKPIREHFYLAKNWECLENYKHDWLKFVLEKWYSIEFRQTNDVSFHPEYVLYCVEIFIEPNRTTCHRDPEKMVELKKLFYSECKQ